MTASIITCHPAGTVFFRAFDFRYLSDNPVVDAPVEAIFPADELYVNCGTPAQHNQYRDATHRAIVRDADIAISRYDCSQKDGMC